MGFLWEPWGPPTSQSCACGVNSVYCPRLMSVGVSGHVVDGPSRPVHSGSRLRPEPSGKALASLTLNWEKQVGNEDLTCFY